nr:hypothetical protein [Tanacetum cinerariifolium]
MRKLTLLVFPLPALKFPLLVLMLPLPVSVLILLVLISLLNLMGPSYMENEEENHALVANEEAPKEFALMVNPVLIMRKFPTGNSRFSTADLGNKGKAGNSQINIDDKGYWDSGFSRILSKLEIKFVKPADSPIVVKTDKKETVKKPTIKYAELYRKTSKRSDVRETLKNEKEGLDGKLAGFQTASKDLDSLFESQRLDKNKEGLGYSAVPPPPAQIYSSPKKDMSWTGLLEFKDNTITDYSRPAPTIESSPDDAQNRNPSANDSPTNSKTDKAETAKKPPIKKRVKKETSRSQNTTHKSFSPKPYRPPMRPVRSNMNGAWPNRTSFNKPAHSYTNRPFQRTSAVRSQYRAPWVPTVNKNFPPVDRKFSTVSRKFSTVNRKFPTANRKFPTGGTKFSTADMGKKGKAVKPSACNISYLSDYEPFDGGYVSFGQGECKITGKETIKTVAKASADECMLWHMRLAHLIFKTMNKLVRVLVNKSQNKTPYELFNGRTPAIGFLKPFSCHVMILNTLDNLGKFEAKGDEGYFIGYSMSSKAFRVFNKRTKRVEENLHVDFLENKPIEKGAGLNWLFDIDSLTNSMNYVLVVVAGTNSTNFLGTKEATGQDVKKDVSSLRYIVLLNWFHEAHLESSTSNSQDACNADAPENSRNSNPSATSTNPSADHMETLAVETLIPTVSSPVPSACLNDSPKPSNILGVTTNTDDTNGMEADLGNIEENISASPTPTLRIYKDHPKSQIIGPVDTPVQTRTKLVAQGHTQEERINYDEVFAHVARIEAIRLFLAYALFMGFTVYQMDDPEFPARVYKVEKAIEFKALMHEKFQMSAMGELNFFLGLQVLQKKDGIFLSQDKYVGDILKKFGYSDVRSSNTPINKENPWGKDETGKDIIMANVPPNDPSIDAPAIVPTPVNPNHAPAQPVEEDVEEEEEDSEEDPKEDSKEEPKDDDEAEVIDPYMDDGSNNPPPLNLEDEEIPPTSLVIPDADGQSIPPIASFGQNFHFGESSSTVNLLTRNSKIVLTGPMCLNLGTVWKRLGKMEKFMFERIDTEGRIKKKFKEQDCHFLGLGCDNIEMDRTVRNVMSNLSGLKKLVNGLSDRFDEYERSKVFDAKRVLEKELVNERNGKEFYQEFGEYMCQMLQNRQKSKGSFPLPLGSQVREPPAEPSAQPVSAPYPNDPYFWSTARIETTDEGTNIFATVDGKLRTIFESSIRRNLKLRDEVGISSLLDAELFENLTLMGYNILPNQKFTFQKGKFSHQWNYLIHTIMQCLSPKRMTVPLFPSMLLTMGEGSGTPTEPHHTPTPEAIPSPQHELSSSSLPPAITETIHTVLPADNPLLETILSCGVSVSISPVTEVSVAEVPTGSGSIPATSPLGTGVPTGSGMVPTASPIFTTATVATPYTRRKGKEKMVESETPKKKKI